MFSGGSGAIERSGLSPRVPLVLALVLASAIAIVVSVLVAVGAVAFGSGLLLLGGLGGGLVYSLPPIAAARRGLGEPFNAILGGFLPLLGVAALSSTIALRDVLAFLPFALVVFASVLATAWPDRLADAATGKAMMQVRLRPPTLRRIALTNFITFVAATAVSAITGSMPWALAGLVVVPLMLIGLRLYTRVTSPLFSGMAMAGHASITTAVLIIVIGTAEGTGA